MKLTFGRELGDGLGFFGAPRTIWALKAAVYCFLMGGGIHLGLAHFAVHDPWDHYGVVTTIIPHNLIRVLCLQSY